MENVSAWLNFVKFVFCTTLLAVSLLWKSLFCFTNKMINEETQYDIKVINAFMSYGENVVINGLHMSVRSGSIYGLLGPSGCGKSTLLRCILGKIPLDSGYIDLKADSLHDIGYMPQDLSLENLLTIKEIFMYYGTLYGMSKKQLKRKIKSLTTFLQLPNLNEYISDLSGGQSRRVSLAISLLHDPKLIILDEPTVGIDPILRQKIWKEFSNMAVNQNKTIIITTHYIEEATRAHAVGFMRKGVLVAEGLPQYIISNCETYSLESAFLALCSGRDENRIVQNDVSNDEMRETAKTQPNLLGKHKYTINFTRIKAIVKKNLRVFFRDYMMIGILFGLPIVLTLAACLGIGDIFRGLNIAVKNDEISVSNCRLYNASGCTTDVGYNQTLSCYIVNHLLSLDYNLIDVTDDKKSEKSIMKLHQSAAYLYFPQNFTNDFSHYVGYYRKNYSFESPMSAYFAKDNSLIKNQVVMDVYKSIQRLIEKTLYYCSKNSRSLSSPVVIEVVLGKQVKTYRHSVVSEFMATGVFFLSSTLGLALMLSERLDGLLERSVFAGVTIIEMLISLFCINLFLVTLQMIGPLILSYIVFQNPILITSSFFMYFVIMIILDCVGFFYAIIVACLSPNRFGAAFVVNGLYIGQLMLSGFPWPIEGQVSWLRPLSKLIPTSIAGLAMNNLVGRGWTWNHPSIIYGTTLLITQLLLLILIIIVLGKIKKDMWILT